MTFGNAIVNVERMRKLTVLLASIAMLGSACLYPVAPSAGAPVPIPHTAGGFHVVVDGYCALGLGSATTGCYPYDQNLQVRGQTVVGFTLLNSEFVTDEQAPYIETFIVAGGAQVDAADENGNLRYVVRTGTEGFLDVPPALQAPGIHTKQDAVFHTGIAGQVIPRIHYLGAGGVEVPPFEVVCLAWAAGCTAP